MIVHLKFFTGACSLLLLSRLYTFNISLSNNVEKKVDHVTRCCSDGAILDFVKFEGRPLDHDKLKNVFSVGIKTKTKMLFRFRTSSFTRINKFL